ncbi:hypothetical protein ACPV5O_20380 [Vibrio maritimus]|uniref:Uncharacterized protein n=1 Tax=Vibrio variabilis TaxID=990271 RepID=A0ABQ0JMB2_9VIBR|nr:hypothetical protein JCM19239_5711 [Vibrio variabilis]
MSLLSKSSTEPISEIVFPSDDKPTPKDKLKGAYINERSKLEVVEVELNRSKVVMIDQDGKMIRVPFLSEH